MDFMCNTQLLGAVCLILWVYYLWSRRRFYKVAWQLPGPLGLPFIGLGLNMMNPETFLQYMAKISQHYSSPFISWMGTNCFLYVNDPQTVETIFNSPHCTNKGEFYRFMATAIGDGLFTSSSPRWNKHRRLINPAFSRQIIKNFLPIFNAEGNALLHKLAIESARHSEGIEIYTLLKKSVLEAACQTTMGKKMNFQNDGSAVIFESYNGITEVCVKRMLSPWLYPDVCYRLSPLYSRQRAVVSVLYNFVETLLLRSAADTNEANATKSDDDNVLDGAFSNGKSKGIFVEQVRKHIEQGALSWNDVRDEANVIIAAVSENSTNMFIPQSAFKRCSIWQQTFETTSTALYLVCLCLAMHPEYQEKLHNELMTVFPAAADSTTTDFNEVTYAQLECLSYTEMVINEAMRLFAPVPMVLRSASADFTLRNGVVVPCGTQIGIDIFNMQRSTLVWGPDALCFRPERQRERPPHAFAYIPFTKGLRMCIGYRYALMLMKVMLAKIFCNFQLRTLARLEDLVIKGTISLKLRDYPLCQVLPRKRAAPPTTI